MAAAPEDIPCPLCKQKIAAAIPDKQLERLLNEKLVYCSNKKHGCTWCGELGRLEDNHLNENPPASDKLMDGCLYVQVLCSQCQRVKIERRKMKIHMENECPKRMTVCTYCRTHRAAYEDISQNHHPVCPCIPVPCPKGCGAKPLRKNIETHVTNLCPKNPQPCPFHIVGCTKKLIGSAEMEHHLNDSKVLKSHLSSMERTVIALKRKNGEKDIEIKILQENLKGKDAQVRKLSMQTKHKDELIYSLNYKLDKIHTRHLQEQARKKKRGVEALKVVNVQMVGLEHEVHTQAEYASELERKVETLQHIVEAQKKEIQHLAWAARQNGYGRPRDNDRRHERQRQLQPNEESRDLPEQPVNPPADHEDGSMMQTAVGVALTAAGVGIGIASLFARR